jgi:hypothetical protein
MAVRGCGMHNGGQTLYNGLHCLEANMRRVNMVHARVSIHVREGCKGGTCALVKQREGGCFMVAFVNGNGGWHTCQFKAKKCILHVAPSNWFLIRCACSHICSLHLRNDGTIDCKNTLEHIAK